MNRRTACNPLPHHLEHLLQRRPLAVSRLCKTCQNLAFRADQQDAWMRDAICTVTRFVLRIENT